MESSPKNSGLESWFERCSELCSSLTSQGNKFSFSLKLEGSFSFSLQSENAVSPRTKKRRSPSYMRRQQRRKANLLEKRSGSSQAEKAAGNQQPEAAAVDTSSPLNLCPKPVYPSSMAESEESAESEDDYDEEKGQDAGSEGRSDATGRDSAPEIKKQEEVEPSREGHWTTVTSRRSGEQRSPIANSNNRGQPSPALSQPPHRIIRIKDAWTNQYGQSGRKNRDHFFTPHVSVYAPADATDAEVAAAVHSVDKSRLRFISGIMCYEFCRESGQFLGNSAIKKLMMANSLPDYVELQNEFLAIQQKHNSK